MTYVRHASGECTVLGFVKREEYTFTITEIVLLKQKNSGANSEIDDDALNQYRAQRLRAEQNAKFQLWMHSHAQMGTFWSGTDTANIERYGDHTEWLISIVSNKAGNHLGRIDVYNPFHMYVNEVPIRIIDAIDQEQITAWEKELDEKEIKYSYASNGKHSRYLSDDEDKWWDQNFPDYSCGTSKHVSAEPQLPLGTSESHIIRLPAATMTKDSTDGETLQRAAEADPTYIQMSSDMEKVKGNLTVIMEVLRTMPVSDPDYTRYNEERKGLEIKMETLEDQMDLYWQTVSGGFS
jgi:hypothetical protein